MPNRLIKQTSPYLLQHSENPVDWYPWGHEAFEEAKRRDSPILLSIGYSACHWCHVMEKESFEDSSIAAQMNRDFVNIKVDREERPDVDDIYMSAVQAISGSGGWPLTVFLSPDGLPFWGGTYFPPQPRGGHPGFPQILEAVADAFANRRTELHESSKKIMDYVGRLGEGEVTELISPHYLDEAFQDLKKQFDWDWGGFGNPIKFPQPLVLTYLLRYSQWNKESEALDMVEFSLMKMIFGGIYDHVGGGFHRYSTDRQWLVPHFEKMLYDNALMAHLFLNVFQETGRHVFRDVSLDIFEYVFRDLTRSDGLFFSAEDADSDGEEGIFYTWTPEELDDVLGNELGNKVARDMHVTQEGNFEGRSIPHPNHSSWNRPLEDQNNNPWLLISKEDRKKLLAYRSERNRPFRDEKCILSWNAMMVCALSDGYLATGNESLRKHAIQNVQTCLNIEKSNGELFRSVKGLNCSGGAFLEDYASFIKACIAVHEITFDPKWLSEAHRLTDLMLGKFWQGEEVIPYDAALGDETLIVRPRSLFDNPIPCGSSQAAGALLALSRLLGIAKYYDIAIGILTGIPKSLYAQPTSAGNFLSTYSSLIFPCVEIAVVGGDLGAIKLFQRVVGGKYMPNRAFTGSILGDSYEFGVEIPLLKGRLEDVGLTMAFLCENYSCQLPTNSPLELASQINDFLRNDE